MISQLIITDDSDGRNNRNKLAKGTIGGNAYSNTSFTHYKKLTQGTHRVVVKFRAQNGSDLTVPSTDYKQIQLQVKVNGSADRVTKSWVVEKL